MRYYSTTPVQFTNEKSFVERLGDTVWNELCDTAKLNVWVNVTDISGTLPSLKNYVRPQQYLRAVLLAVKADYEARPEDYERPPFVLRNTTLNYIKL